MATRTTQELNEALAVLDAERLVETVKLRCALVKECAALLPTAIEQAKPQGTGKNRRLGNASLLRLISRVAMRDVKLDRKK
jgi:hypothetical protein